MKLNNKGNWSLIGLLLAVVIVMVVAAIYLGGSKNANFTTVGSKNQKLLDSKSQKETVVGKAMDTARASDCSEHLRQIRMGIENFKMSGTDDKNPASLKDLNLGVPETYFKCPVSNQPYTYDPATGTVKCPTHTNF